MQAPFTSYEAILWAGSSVSNVDAFVEALVGNGAMEEVVPQGVGDVADHLLSAALHHRGLGLNHGYGEEEEGVAKLRENHRSSCWRWLSLRFTGLLRGLLRQDIADTGATFRCSFPCRSI